MQRSTTCFCLTVIYVERNPNNIKIVLSDTFKISLKVSELKVQKKIIHGLSFLVKFHRKISVLECLICQWTMQFVCPFFQSERKSKSLILSHFSSQPFATARLICLDSQRELHYVYVLFAESIPNVDFHAIESVQPQNRTQSRLCSRSLRWRTRLSFTLLF